MQIKGRFLKYARIKIHKLLNKIFRNRSHPASDNTYRPLAYAKMHFIKLSFGIRGTIFTDSNLINIILMIYQNP